jgi:hypothetical protein
MPLVVATLKVRLFLRMHRVPDIVNAGTLRYFTFILAQDPIPPIGCPPGHWRVASVQPLAVSGREPTCRSLIADS